ncbi:MAG: molecular chaperone DnaJ, partial [Deltaproteobacteria bacterium]|nr:molecular chaperone DnaJ [Deltaproteobacteria bacterium]
KFKEINEAYSVLKDPQKRARYDQVGFAGAGTGMPEGGFGNDFGDFFGDIFSDIFGAQGGGGRGQGRGRPPQRGQDLRYDMDITFEEAAFGTSKTVTIPRVFFCDDCEGSGASSGSGAETCGDCHGAGQVNFTQGFFSVARTCPKCRGNGKVIKDPCSTCSGVGRIRKSREISINIPEGVDTGSRLRLTGEGDFGEKGAPPGDLYIVLEVAPHPIFIREEDDLICEVPMGFPEATLGAEIEVPTLEGTVKLKVPPGTQTGKVFTLKHKGLASLNRNRRGDQHVILKLETPVKLSKKQKELLREFSGLAGDGTLPGKKSFLDKVKELFE